MKKMLRLTRQSRTGITTIILLVVAAVLLPNTLLPYSQGILGADVLDPANVWAPYGPRTDKLMIAFYADQLTELTGFELGSLDLTGTPVQKSKWAAYDGNPDFLLTPAQREFGYLQVDFNHESSTWTAWGCDFANGLSPCGIEIRQAFAHLIDRMTLFAPRGDVNGDGIVNVVDFAMVGAAFGAVPRAANWNGLADLNDDGVINVIDLAIVGGSFGSVGDAAVADPTSPAMFPAGSSLAVQNAWDTLHVTYSAFNIAPDLSGFATPGSDDMCAARDHLLAAGVGFLDADANCVIDNPGVALASPIRFMIRTDDPYLETMGTGLMDTINLVFGADIVSETFGNANMLGTIVFNTAPAIDDWDMYTGEWLLRGPFSDHLRPLYGSLFASAVCGGTPNARPLNYGFICVPALDAPADAASQTDALVMFTLQTLAAFDAFGSSALNIPAYSRALRTVALRDTSGLVNEQGYGYDPPFWSTLNSRADPAYTPVDPAYEFGGGDPTTLRWGQSQGITTLNIFQARTPWERNVLSTMYEGLVRASPVEPTKVISWMANRYTTTIDGSGNTHIVFDLRKTMRWHDGTPITADDVKFSILNYRDIPAALFAGEVSLVNAVNVLSPDTVEIVWRGRSLSHLLNSGVPIIPKHLWDADSDGIADPAKVAAGFDPLASGILVGSGPWVCRSLFAADLGTIGTGCGINSDGTRSGQDIRPGGKMLLEKYDFATIANPYHQYMRSYNIAWPSGGTRSGQFQDWSWADKDNDAVVDISDLASVSGCVGPGPSPSCSAADFAYWNRLGNPAAVDSTETNAVSDRLDETWVDPFLWDPSLVNIVPFVP